MTYLTVEVAHDNIEARLRANGRHYEATGGQSDDAGEVGTSKSEMEMSTGLASIAVPFDLTADPGFVI